MATKTSVNISSKLRTYPINAHTHGRVHCTNLSQADPDC